MTYHKRQSNLYQPGSSRPFGISRSKIDLFLECPRCFYIDRRLGLGRPSMPAFTLNSAVDALLKKEFDLLRKSGQAHVLMKEYGIEAIPFDHPELPVWRDDMHHYIGVSVQDSDTNLIVSGIIDDVWIDPQKELLLVDYKATSTTREISLDDTYKQGYKRQLEVYQWIFRKKGFPVSDTGYFVFANATKNRERFDGRLEFVLSIIAHRGNAAWVGSTLRDIRACLESERLPKAATDCEFCQYRRGIGSEMERFRR